MLLTHKVFCSFEPEIRSGSRISWVLYAWDYVWMCVSVSFLQMRCRLFLGAAWRGCKWEAGRVVRATVDEITHGPIILSSYRSAAAWRGIVSQGAASWPVPSWIKALAGGHLWSPSPFSPSLTLQINDWSENRLDEFHFYAHPSGGCHWSKWIAGVGVYI